MSSGLETKVWGITVTPTVIRPKAIPCKVSLQDLIPASSCNHDLMFPVSQGVDHSCRNRRKRRLRPMRSRRQVANDCDRNGRTTIADIDNVEVNEPWWVKQGLWAIETCNVNSWESGRSAMLSRSKADVVFLQETRLLNETTLHSAERQARKDGWNPTLSIAHRTAEHHGSGGCAVLARAGTGIASAPGDLIPHDMRHRLHLAWTGAVLKGGIFNLSVYLKDAEGLGETNMALLDAAAVCLNALNGPWIMAGDWNVTPQTLEASNWLKIVKGVVHATALPTCHSSTYDFFCWTQKHLARCGANAKARRRRVVSALPLALTHQGKCQQVLGAKAQQAAKSCGRATCGSPLKAQVVC